MEWFLDNALIPILGTIITAAISAGAAAVTRWTGINVEAKHREALHSAIMTGIGYARSGLTPGGAAPSMGLVVDQAKDYVLKSVPDALAYFGLKEGTMLYDMIAAKAQILVEEKKP